MLTLSYKFNHRSIPEAFPGIYGLIDFTAMAVGPRRHMNLYQSLYCYGIKMKRRSSQWADIHTLLKSVQADCEIYISERERREACGLMCNAYTNSPTTKGH